MDYTKKLNRFINKASKVHNNKYIYNKVIYKSNLQDVIITCPIHGDFKQKPHIHLRGCGCQKCGYSKLSKLKCDGLDKFIEKANKLHKYKYDYSVVNYINSRTKVEIICPEHGSFWQLPSSHLSGFGCPKCGGILPIGNEVFISRSKKVHGNKYDYSLVNYKNYESKVKIICPIHGVFEQSPYAHMRGQGCPVCSESKGERLIYNFLKRHNLFFIPQYKFDDCKRILTLPFDFAVFNNDGSIKFLIEYQGEQHFIPVDYFGGITGFNYRMECDNIKRKFCDENGIPLYYITYKDSVDSILTKIFNKGE